MWYFSKLTRKWFLFLITNERREWKYWEGSGKISKLNTNCVQESLRLQPIMILILFFCNLTIFFILSVSVEWMGSIKFCWEREFHYWATHGTSGTFPYPKLVTDTKMAQDIFKTGPDFRRAFHILAINTRSFLTKYCRFLRPFRSRPLGSYGLYDKQITEKWQYFSHKALSSDWAITSQLTTKSDRHF